jgi:hypothetical protein
VIFGGGEVNVFAVIFGALWRGLKAIFRTAQARGLTTEILDKAKGVAVAASQMPIDSGGKREWALLQLRSLFAGTSESILRLAVELAVQWLKGRDA